MLKCADECPLLGNNGRDAGVTRCLLAGPIADLKAGFIRVDFFITSLWC